VPTVHVAIVGTPNSLQHAAGPLRREILTPLLNSKLFRSRFSLTLIADPGQSAPALPAPLSTWPTTIVDPAATPGATDSPIPAELRPLLHALHVTYYTHIVPYSPDYVIFIRPDVLIDGKLPLTRHLLRLMASPGTHHKRLLAPPGPTEGGVSDRFAVMTASAAVAYFTRTAHAADYFVSHPDATAEEFLADALNRVTVSTSITTPMRLLRSDGAPIPDPIDSATRLSSRQKIRVKAEKVITDSLATLPFTRRKRRSN